MTDVTQADLSDRALSLMWLMASQGELDGEHPWFEPYCDDRMETDPINECFKTDLLKQWQQGEDLFCIRITDKGRAFIDRLQSTAALEAQLAEAKAENERLREALAVIAYEEPEKPWLAAHNTLAATATRIDALTGEPT